MVKKCWLLFVLLISSVHLFAQAKLQVSGQIIDSSTGEVLPYSSALILNPSDSSIVQGSLADEDGKFAIEVASGNYIFKAQFIGYQDYFQEITPSTSQLDLGKIGLQINANEIEEVEVIGQRSETTYHLDKKVFTVGSDLTAVGSTAIDVLSDVPSVSTDIDGNVSLRGSEGVQILINGKPSGLTGLGTTNALKNIPADLIEKVEVITNPSARYDAQGQVGIINIVLKKQRDAGFNGSVDANIGYPNQLGGSVNLNYRKNKVNLFTTLGTRYNERPGEGFANYNYYNPNNGVYFSSNNRDFLRSGLSYSGNLGMEYFITDKHSFTGSIGYTTGDDSNETTIVYSDFDAFKDLLSETKRTDHETEDEQDLQYNLNYFFDIDKKKGKKLTADVRFENTDETEGSDYFERTIFGELEPTVTEKSLNDESQKEYLFQVDYVNPFSEKKKFELGAKSTLRNINTDFSVDRMNASGIFEPVQELTNQFDYNEDIYALYGQFANEKGRVSYQLGLRGEYSDIVTELRETNEINARDYFSLFPSAFLNYKTKGSNSIQLSYSRRFQRPGFWHLNPFLTYSDARRRFTGNPNLNPEFTHSLELGYLKEWDKSTINSSVYYRRTTDMITRITIPLEADTVLIMPVNLNSEQSGGFEFIVNSDLTKWWTIDGSLNLFYFNEDGSNIGSSYTASDFSWMSRVSSRFKFDSGYTGQLRAFYRAPQKTTQGSRNGLYSIDMALAKDLLKRKGTLTFNVRDLTNSRKRRSTIYTDNYFSEDQFQWQSRSITLGFNYRINQQNKKRQQQQRENGDFGGEGGGEF